MTHSIAKNRLEMPIISTYGAVELKEYIKKYTWQGCLATILLISTLILAFLLVADNKEIVKIDIRVPQNGIEVTSVQNSIPEVELSQPIPPPAEQIIKYMTATRAGSPVPISNLEIEKDLNKFAAWEEITSSLASSEGELIDLNDLSKNLNFGDKPKEIEIANAELIPASDVFIPVEIEPQIDLAELQRNVVYPKIAVEAGIEGKVIVNVFVDKYGKVRKTEVIFSESQLLNQAALDAVSKTTFTAAIQNKEPIGCWVSIPINFKLR